MTWYTTAKSKFETAAKSTGKEMPTIVGVNTLTAYQVDDISFFPLPANHGTGIAGEQALIYLMVKGNASVLYATDTGGIMSVGAQFAGFDNHSSNKNPLTSLIMEATMGKDYDDDWRIFSHSSLGTVERITSALKKVKLLKGDVPVYTTHMAKSLHPTYEEQLRTFPEGILPAKDGLEV
jgi:hypothetical protein